MESLQKPIKIPPEQVQLVVGSLSCFREIVVNLTDAMTSPPDRIVRMSLVRDELLRQRNIVLSQPFIEEEAARFNEPAINPQFLNLTQNLRPARSPSLAG